MDMEYTAKKIWKTIKKLVDDSQTFGVFNDMDSEDEERLDDDCITAIIDILEDP